MRVIGECGSLCSVRIGGVQLRVGGRRRLFPHACGMTYRGMDSHGPPISLVHPLSTPSERFSSHLLACLVTLYIFPWLAPSGSVIRPSNTPPPAHPVTRSFMTASSTA